MKGIIFSTDEVQAILEGRKTQHRIAVKNMEMLVIEHNIVMAKTAAKYKDTVIVHAHFRGNITKFIEQYSPYQVGDILYCKETWRNRNGIAYSRSSTPEPIDDVTEIEYKDNTSGCFWGACNLYPDEFKVNWNEWSKWQPSTRMKKEVARIFMKVTNIRVARLQDIECNEALEEGTEPVYTEYENSNGLLLGSKIRIDEEATIKRYILEKQMALKISKDENPWQWVIDFKRIEKKLIGNDSQKCCNNCHYLNHDYYNCQGEKDLNSKCHEYTLSKERVIEFEKIEKPEVVRK